MLAAPAVRDLLLGSVRDVVAEHVAIPVGRALVPDGVVTIHLSGSQIQERPASLRLVETPRGVVRQIEQDDPSKAAVVDTAEQQPVARHARPVLPLVRVDTRRRIAVVAGDQVEEPQIGPPAVELLIDEPVAVDVAVRAVRSPGVDLERLAIVERARVDVVLIRVRPAVLLPGEEVVPADRLELAEPRHGEEARGLRRPCLRGDRGLHRQNEQEPTQKGRSARRARRTGLAVDRVGGDPCHSRFPSPADRCFRERNLTVGRTN